MNSSTDVMMKSSLDDLIKKDKKFLRKKRISSQGKTKGGFGAPAKIIGNMPRRLKNRGTGIFKKKNSSTGG